MQELLNQEKSIYLQIKEMIEQDILRDILLEEERVPSTNELAKLYAINPATAAKGVNLLVDEGILYKKRGIGMFVAAGAKEAIRKKRREHFFENYVKGMLTEAANLGISKEQYRSDSGAGEDLWPDRKKRRRKDHIALYLIRTEPGYIRRDLSGRRACMGKSCGIAAYFLFQGDQP